MGIRTTPEQVQAVLLPGRDYDLENNPDLSLFIATASGMVDWVVDYAGTYTDYPLTDNQAMLIETWLAAHFYVQSDQPYASRSTSAGGSGSFQGGTGQGLANSKYGLTALKADWSGGLTILDKRAFASMASLGYCLDLPGTSTYNGNGSTSTTPSPMRKTRSIPPFPETGGTAL